MVLRVSEAVNLSLALFLTPMILVCVRSMPGEATRFLKTGILLMVAGYVATIAEGFAASDIFNVVEHACYAASGLAFALFFRASTRKREVFEESSP
jgi:hypothetical protein